MRPGEGSPKVRFMELKGAGAVVALAARVMLGAWFLYSGGVKIFGTGLDRFTRDVANYRLLTEPWDGVVAYTLPWLEVVAGVCLMLGIWRRGAILLVAGMVGMFSVAIGWAWSKGLDISCGCRGGDAPIDYWAKVAEFAGYAVVLAGLWWWELRREKSGEPEF